jgi:hypothetical protein
MIVDSRLMLVLLGGRSSRSVAAFHGPPQNRFSNLRAVIETTDYGQVGIAAQRHTDSWVSQTEPGNPENPEKS